MPAILFLTASSSMTHCQRGTNPWARSYRRQRPDRSGFVLLEFFLIQWCDDFVLARNYLGFALQLKYYQLYARFLDGDREVAGDVTEYLVDQLEVGTAKLDAYDWGGRSRATRLCQYSPSAVRFNLLSGRNSRLAQPPPPLFTLKQKFRTVLFSGLGERFSNVQVIST